MVIYLKSIEFSNFGEVILTGIKKSRARKILPHGSLHQGFGFLGGIVPVSPPVSSKVVT